jgi:predicted metal-dependent HD superfamily phosphohydrolase
MSAGMQGWMRTWHDLGKLAADEALYTRLMTCWTEGHRRYHTLQHLRECLVLFDDVREQAMHPGEITLALWFHDAFYDPRRKDNEERSADWARDSVLEAGLPADVAGRVHALVMATRHEAAPDDADAQLLVDVDLAILGAETPRFDESDAQIRVEYAHVPEDQFREGRRHVLNGFLARPRLYTTEHFHSALEERARGNLRRALARLET